MQLFVATVFLIVLSVVDAGTRQDDKVKSKSKSIDQKIKN